jgi:peptidoglycan-associated lipoprotein
LFSNEVYTPSETTLEHGTQAEEVDIMKNRSLVHVLILLTMSVFLLWGCPKKAEVASAPEAPPEIRQEAAPAEDAAKAAEEQKAAAAAAAKAAEEAKAAAEAKERAAAAASGLQPIYFDFDKSFIRDDAKAVMKANADWLKANPKARVRIEGDCDERGTKEYNQALGQRRAASAKKYLTDLGISAKRISLISYGKEKPVCTESNEACMQKNRRDDIVVAE